MEANTFYFYPNSKEFREILPSSYDMHIANNENERRPARARHLDPIEISSPKGSALTLPGTITLFIAKKGCKLMEEIGRSIHLTGASLDPVFEKIKKQFAGRKTVPLSKAVDMLRSQPVFGELRYKNQVIARHLFTYEPDQVCIVTLPYTGGKIGKEDLQFVEYYNDAAASLDVVAVRNSVTLTPAEQAALNQVAYTGLNGNPVAGPCDADFVEALLMVLLYAALLRPADMSDQHISEEVIREIGPEATARELLFLRRSLLKQQQRQV